MIDNRTREHYKKYKYNEMRAKFERLPLNLILCGLGFASFGLFILLMLEYGN